MATMPAKDSTGRRPPKQAKVRSMAPRPTPPWPRPLKLATRDPRKGRGR
jgi:hypothetical protein